MREHINILAWLHIVVNALHLLGALAVWFLFAAIGGVAAVSDGGADGAAAGGLLVAIGTFVFGVVAVTGIPGLILGRGLLQRASWSRILGLVLSVLMLPAAPLGTALGIYGLWVLTNADAARELDGGGRI